MSHIGSASTNDDDEHWLDVDDATSLPSISLDEALLQIDQFDDSLLLNDQLYADDDSTLGGEIFSGRSSADASTNFQYTLECPLSYSQCDSITAVVQSVESQYGRARALAYCIERLALTEALLHSVKGEERLGSGSCAAFSEDGSHLAIGYSKGAVRIINASTGSSVYIIHEAGQPGRGILQTVFLSRQRTLLALDSGGSVFEIRLRRKITGKRKELINCIFSGCNGEVVFMRYVPVHHLLVLVTLTKVLVVSTNHGGAVLCSVQLEGAPDAPPQCDYWLEGRESVRMCFGRGTQLFVYRVFPGRLALKGVKSAELIANIETSVPLISFSFISESFIWYLDVKEAPGVYDVNTRTALPQLTPPTLEIIYATADFKACRYNIGKFLCSAIHKFVLLSPIELIDNFLSRKDHISASLYALDIVKGKVKAARSQSIRSKVEKKLDEIIYLLVEWIMDGLPGGKVAVLVAHYRKYIDLLLKVCHQADRMALFYTIGYPRIEQDGLARAVMFELLDEAVMDGALVDPPPSLVADYLQNLQNEGHFAQLQAAIVRLPIYCIDIHWVMSTCRQNRLFDGIIYISNKALYDFVGPLEELMTNVSLFSERELRADSEIDIGNKLMLYLYCCLAGQAYPFGDLPPELVDKVPLEVYRCITSLRGKDGVASEERYPYLRQLLQFDAQQFFHVLCQCAGVALFSAENRLERLLDILCTLCIELLNEPILEQMLLCIAHLAANARILPQTTKLEEAVHALLMMPTLSESAETAVVDVLRAVPEIPLQHPLQLAQRSPLKTKTCTYILSTERRFIELIDCFLRHGAPTTELFSVITRFLCYELTPGEYKDLTTYLKEHLEELTSLSPKDAAALVVDHFIDHFARLRPMPGADLRDSMAHFPLLKECFQLKRDRGEHAMTMDDALDEDLFSLTFHGLIDEHNDYSEKLDAILTDWLRYWLPLGSRSDRCLNAASAVEATEACVLLLEARGFSGRAFELLKQRLVEESSKVEINDEALLQQIDRCVQFCSCHVEEARAGGWMPTLFRHVIALTQNRQNNNLGVRSRLLSMTRRMLESDTSIAVELITALYEAPFFAEAKYGENAALLDSILMACSYQKAILTSLHSCQDEEMSDAMMKLSQLSTKRLPRLAGGPCIKCRGSIDKAAYVFSCGHLIHMECDENGSRTCPCEAPGAPKYPETLPVMPPNRAVAKRNVFANWNEDPDCAPRPRNLLREKRGRQL
ncbi:unnamed protein product, partial [Mesorhabditis spiculigera]